MTSFTDLVAGDYTVCITIDENQDYEHCFDISISQPDALSVSSKVSNLDNEVSLELSGGSEYFITLNDQVFVTSDTKITLPLSSVENQLTIHTDKFCQGEHEETIVLSGDAIIYPNPIGGGDLTIYLGNLNLDEIALSMFSMSGKSVVFNKTIPTSNNSIRFNVDRIPPGIYIVNVKADARLLTYKIIRK